MAAASSSHAAPASLRGQVMVHVAVHNAGAGDPASWAKRRADWSATTADALNSPPDGGEIDPLGVLAPLQDQAPRPLARTRPSTAMAVRVCLDEGGTCTDRQPPRRP